MSDDIVSSAGLPTGVAPKANGSGPDGASLAYMPVARVEDIPPGWVLKTRLGAMEIALANVGGEIHAIDNACPHAGGPLGDNRLKDGCFVECPWHNSVFDVTTGEIVSGAARKPVVKLQVVVEAGVVHVASARVREAQARQS